MFLKTPINAGKQVAATIFILLLFWQAASHKWNSHLNWNFTYLLWKQRKLLRSTCNTLKRKTLMKILNSFNVLWHTVHWSNCVCEQTECYCTALKALHTSAALHISSLLLILMIPRWQPRSIITLPSPLLLYYIWKKNETLAFLHSKHHNTMNMKHNCGTENTYWTEYKSRAQWHKHSSFMCRWGCPLWWLAHELSKMHFYFQMHFAQQHRCEWNQLW